MDIGHGTLRSTIEALFAHQVESVTASADFQALENGSAPPDHYDEFIENVVRAHLRSPQLLAFLYALAPPAAAADLQHNLLEELGLEEESARPHPDLLRDLLAGRASAAGSRSSRPRPTRTCAASWWTRCSSAHCVT